LIDDQEYEKRVRAALEFFDICSYERLRELIDQGTLQEFRSEHGGWITELAGSHLFLNVWVIAGESPGIMDIQPRVIEYARSMGCTRLTATGRRGLLKLFPPHGWKWVAVGFELNLDA
jgi:hypothetical protein